MLKWLINERVKKDYSKATNSEELKCNAATCNLSAVRFGLTGAPHRLKLQKKKIDGERNVVATFSHIPRHSLRRPSPNPLDPFLNVADVLCFSKPPSNRGSGAAQ